MGAIRYFEIDIVEKNEACVLSSVYFIVDLEIFKIIK
jgi:hypothetical protein